MGLTSAGRLESFISTIGSTPKFLSKGRLLVFPYYPFYPLFKFRFIADYGIISYALAGALIKRFHNERKGQRYGMRDVGCSAYQKSWCWNIVVCKNLFSPGLIQAYGQRQWP